MVRRDGRTLTSSNGKISRKDKRVWVESRDRGRRYKKRYKSKRIHEMYSMAVLILTSCILVPEAANSQYTVKEVVDATLYLSMNNLFIEGGVDELSLGKMRAISADTIIRLIDGIHWKDLLNQLRDANNILLEGAKERGLLDGPQILAIDFHKVPRYRKRRRRYKRRAKDLPMAVGVGSLNGTALAHKIATIDVVANDSKMTLDFIPWHPGSRYKDVVEGLVSRARRWVKISLILLDREFFNYEVISTLISMGMDFIIPVRRNERVNVVINKCKGRRFHIEEFSMGDIAFTLVVIDTEELDRGRDWEHLTEKGEYFVYATNLSVHGENCIEIAELYRGRWGIETGYRDKKGFRGKTCSLSYSVRLYLTMLSMILSNIWILMKDILKRELWLPDGRLTAHMMRFLLSLFIIALYEPDLLEEVLAPTQID